MNESSEREDLLLEKLHAAHNVMLGHDEIVETLRQDIEELENDNLVMGEHVDELMDKLTWHAKRLRKLEWVEKHINSLKKV